MENVKTTEKPCPGRILIVDDDMTNRLVLRAVLENDGHTVTEAANGREALDQVNKVTPEVILLDVIMPDIDGYEVCRTLKQNPKTLSIPILMVTSLTEKDDMIKGIEVGASDFLSKPIWAPEIVMRVRNALSAKRLYDRALEDFERLKELERLRDELTHMIVHDLRSPLMSVVFGLELHNKVAGSKLTEKEMEPVQEAAKSATRLVEMVSSLLDVSKLEAGKMQLNIKEYNMADIVSDAMKTFRGLAESCTVMPLEAPEEIVNVHCDRELIRRVVLNLGANAVKFVPSDGIVRVCIENAGGQVKVRVIDNGMGIPPEYHTKIFEKFGQVGVRKEGRMYSTGLGLAFCKLAVEAHGGKIGVESVVGKGSTFWFTLPSHQT